MSRTVLVGLALVVVLASAGPAAVGSAAGDRPTDVGAPATAPLATDGPPVATTGGPARMHVGPRELVRTETGTAGPDLGAAVGTGADAFGARLSALSADYRFDAVSSASDRRSVVDQAIIRFEERSAALIAAQRTALRAYANGSIDRRTLLVRLARIHRTAVHLEPRLGELRRLADRADARYFGTRLTRVRGELRTLQGPVRERVAAAVAAERPLPPVRVEAAADAVVLSYVAGDEYVRESYFLGNRRTNGSQELDTIGEAADRARGYYRWAYDNQAGNSGIDGNLPARLYSVRVAHDQGALRAYLDAGTGRVFKEHQRLRLAAVATSPRATATADGLRVVLNATYPGGPMRVELYDAASGERVGGRLELGGRNYTVPASGPLWVVEPRGTYDATVEADRATVNVSVPPETVRSRAPPVAPPTDG